MGNVRILSKDKEEKEEEREQLSRWWMVKQKVEKKKTARMTQRKLANVI